MSLGACKKFQMSCTMQAGVTGGLEPEDAEGTADELDAEVVGRIDIDELETEDVGRSGMDELDNEDVGRFILGSRCVRRKCEVTATSSSDCRRMIFLTLKNEPGVS